MKTNWFVIFRRSIRATIILSFNIKTMILLSISLKRYQSAKEGYLVMELEGSQLAMMKGSSSSVFGLYWNH